MLIRNRPIAPAAYDELHLSVSTVAWDGHSHADTLGSMARLGITRIEWALITAYMDAFSDADLDVKLASELRALMTNHGQHCPGLSSHTDGGAEQVAVRLETHLRFAHKLGPDWLITNAADRSDRDAFYRNLKRIKPLADELGIRIVFENPGDAGDHLINCADDLPNFLATLDRRYFGINYDAGNLASHRPEIDAQTDLLKALANYDHLHLKAVRCVYDVCEFGALGYRTARLRECPPGDGSTSDPV